MCSCQCRGIRCAEACLVLQDPSQILEEYGADALRLYLVNSPVVHAEVLRFKKEGVFGVVKDVFLPWYNAYRFLVQNVLRLEADCGERFNPSQVSSRDPYTTPAMH